MIGHARKLARRALGIDKDLGRIRSLVSVVATVDTERDERVRQDVEDLAARLAIAEARIGDLYVPELIGNL